MRTRPWATPRSRCGGSCWTRYPDLTGPQIVELKKQGVPITRRVEIPLVTYCGDTAAGDFLGLDHVRNSRILLLECTFVEEDHTDRVRLATTPHSRPARHSAAAEQ